MSAFIVCNKHINTLVTWASENGIAYKGCPVKGHEQGFATALYRQNVRSVNYRYNEDTPFYGIRYEPEHLDSFYYDNERHELAQIVKACNCYDYQACETDNYFDTPSREIIATIRDDALRTLRMTKEQVYNRYNDVCEWTID